MNAAQQSGNKGMLNMSFPYSKLMFLGLNP